jgi:hypothetical protein
MTRARNLALLQELIISIGLAQALFWVFMEFLCRGLSPFDLVFFWLTVPALGLSLIGKALPLAAGLAMAGIVINLGLLAALAT